MFGIKRDDFTKMSMYNLQDLMIAYSVSTIEKKLLAFTFPHLRMFTLYCLVCLLSPARALDDLGHFEGVSAFGMYSGTGKGLQECSLSKDPVPGNTEAYIGQGTTQFNTSRKRSEMSSRVKG